MLKEAIKQSNNEVARNLIDSMSSRDFSSIEPFLSDDLKFDFPGSKTVSGKRRVLIFLNTLLRKYPKLKFQVTDVFSTDDRSCIVWTNEGQDINGDPYSNNGITLIHYKNNRVIFMSDYFKDTSFTQSK